MILEDAKRKKMALDTQRKETSAAQHDTASTTATSVSTDTQPGNITAFTGGLSVCPNPSSNNHHVYRYTAW